MDIYKVIPVLFFSIMQFLGCYAQDYHTANLSGLSREDSLLFEAVSDGNTEQAEELLSSGISPATATIEGITPLMMASSKGKRSMVRLLLKHNANVRAVDQSGATALMYGSAAGNRSIARLLIKNGAQVNRRDDNGKTAFDYAIINSHTKVGDFLKIAFERNLPHYYDGPYVKTNLKNSRATVFYFLNDSATGRASIKKEKIKSTTGEFIFRGIYPDTATYNLYPITPAKYEYDGIDSVLVIGDVHGGYDALVSLLKVHGIISPDMNWKWGKNHLVFIGDIFDRGDQVTEALWLIYKLQRQALKTNGRVHFILGNHELLIMEGNIDYISEKYFYLSDKLKFEYSYLFSEKYILGRWLRKQPVIVRINESLFIHAGVHPLLLEYPYSIKEMNQKVNYYLKHGLHFRNRSDEPFLLFMTGPHGPLWYRNMVKMKNNEVVIDGITIDRTLEHFDIQRIIIGHTNIPEISSFYDEKVFFTDVPYYNPYSQNYGEIQGLLISNDQVKSLRKDGAVLPVPSKN